MEQIPKVVRGPVATVLVLAAGIFIGVLLVKFNDPANLESASSGAEGQSVTVSEASSDKLADMIAGRVADKVAEIVIERLKGSPPCQVAVPREAISEVGEELMVKYAAKLSQLAQADVDDRRQKRMQELKDQMQDKILDEMPRDDADPLLKNAIAGGEGMLPGEGTEAVDIDANEPVENPHMAYITQTGPFEYSIDLKQASETLADLGVLGRDARIVPNYNRSTGLYQGFKLIGVRPGSLYRAIGIRSGDVVMKVNGAEVNLPSQVLSTLTQLQTAGTHTVSLNRRGTEITMTYVLK